MLSPRLVLSAILLAGFGTACTAIVLGKVGDTSDYPTVPNGSSRSDSKLDECSLLKSDNFPYDRDANPCSTCIETSCKSDIAYACTKERTTQKAWFREMKECAQKPWNGTAPPGENNSWGCEAYAKPKPPIPDNGSDTQREVEAHNCVSTCVKGELPACKQCEVHIKKSQASPDEALLRDDPCGRCLVETCPAVLVECCDTPAIDEFVQNCAFTNDPEKKTKCLSLGTTLPDAGNVKNYDDAGIQCFKKLAACFNASCKGNEYKCK